MTRTARLQLRPVASGDAACVFAIYGDPATNTFNPAGPLPDQATADHVLETWLACWRNHGFGPWAVSTNDEPAHVIGFGGLSHYDYGGVNRINLGYRFAVEAWGKGYATEVARAALENAFGALRLDDVYALVRPDHAASIRVLEKVGMRRFGTLDDAPPLAESLVFVAARTGLHPAAAPPRTAS